MKETLLYQSLLVLHIISGFTALGTGIIAIVSRKGGKLHKGDGNVYYWAMMGVAFTSFAMCMLYTNYFLFMVGLFSFYMTFTGKRVLLFKNLKKKAPGRADWAVWAVSVALLAGLLGVMLYKIGFNWHPVLPMVVVFGFFLAAMLVEDYVFFRNYTKAMKGNWWLLKHISRIMGAFIATVTAFVVTNIETDPMWIGWLAPTAIFTPVITYYQRKFSPKKKKPAVVSG